MIQWLQKKGLEVKLISPFEDDSFIEKGGDFLLEKYEREVGEAQIKHSLSEQEQELAKKLIQAVLIEKLIPKLSKINELVSAGYLIICNVNLMKLNKKSGYPGLHQQENRMVSTADFEAAWSYPNNEA